MPTTIRTFLPPGYHRLPSGERSAIYSEAYAKLQAHRAARKIAIAHEKEQKAARAMTCQVCGRAIFAETGVIAHHGYTRPYEGLQTSSCYGARELPFEVDRAALLVEIKTTEHNVAGLSAFCDDLRNDVMPVTWTFADKTRGKDRHGRWNTSMAKITPATFDEVRASLKDSFAHSSDSYVTFADRKRAQLYPLEQRLEAMTRYLHQQRDRAAAWRQTHRLGGAGEPVWVAL